MKEDVEWVFGRNWSKARESGDLTERSVKQFDLVSEHAYRRGFQQGVHEALRAATTYGLSDWDSQEARWGPGALGKWLSRVSAWRVQLERTTRVFHHPPYWESNDKRGARLQ